MAAPSSGVRQGAARGGIGAAHAAREDPRGERTARSARRDPPIGVPPRRAGTSRPAPSRPAATRRSSGTTRSPAKPAARTSGTSSSPAAPGPGRRRSPAAQRRRTLTTIRAGQRAAGPPRFSNYQGIILAEFVVAELLVSATPIATRKNQEGLSPYVPRDITKLLAIGMVYFLLELLAVGGRGAGRTGAWIGGLILLTVGLSEAANIAKDLNIFGGGGSGQQATGTSQKTGTTTAGGRG